MHHILIVDDEPSCRNAIRRHLQRAGYAVSEVETGTQALERLDTVKPDLVFMDVLMPGIDGIETVRRLRTRWSASELPVIMLSGVNEKSQWVDAFAAGANDFLPKIYEPNELLARITTQLTLCGLHKKLQEKNAQLEQEKELASHMQRWLLEIPPPPSYYHVETHYEPYDRVGGDYFNFFQTDAFDYALVGDVSGHSTASALLMAACKSMLNALAYRMPDPLEIVQALNRQVMQVVHTRGIFSTLVLARIDRRNNELLIVSAGHPPSYLLTPAGLTALQSSGLPVGVAAQNDWRCERHPFAPGQALLLYTDGIVDARDHSDAPFGQARLEALLRQNCANLDQLMPIVQKAVENYSGGTRTDDATMLLVHRLN